MKNSIDVIQQRTKAALQLAFIADSLAMPVHWYYEPLDIFNAFSGGIQKFENAPAKHPMSFMSLKSANSSDGTIEIVGNIILKDKRKFWGIPNEHVHQGMKAGENTLNAHCARLVIRTLIGNNGHYGADKFLDNYIAFMTADVAQHPDTYAESYHRHFFENLHKGVDRKKCGVASDDIGGLVTVAPVAISELLGKKDVKSVQKICREHLFLTHPDEKLGHICDAYVELIASFLFRDDSEDGKLIIAGIAKKSASIDLVELAKATDDNDIVGKKFSKACPIDSSWPSVLYFAYKYIDNPKAGLLANVNVGGDNAHRGAVLGVLLGLASADGQDDLFLQLADEKNIAQEINAFNTLCGS